MQYILHIHKTDYTNYSLISDNDKIDLTEPSLITGLFHLDIVEYDRNIIKLVKRNLPKYIAGELELYSKYTFKANKRGVPTYIFRPLDICYPKFLVSSTLKKKQTSNQYVTIEYQNWTENSLFPKGNIVRIFGSIYDKNAIEESLLYKYFMDNSNMKHDFKGISSKFKSLIIDTKKREFIDRRIVSIDPEGCTDIDDAFSISFNNNILNLDIHISDVYYVLKSLNLIDKINNTTSIYLTNSVKHMLPTIISSGIGSLLEDTIRFMLTLSIKYNTVTEEVDDIQFNKTYGKITKNYNYNNYPKNIDKYFINVSKMYKIITKQIINIDDSHKFIEALMIMYNTYFCENVMKTSAIKIYRTQLKKHFDIADIDNDLSSFLKLIHSNSAEYSTVKTGHTTLGIDSYTHVTSPLRRLIDLINQEIYYTNHSTILDRISLVKINSINKKLKRYYREINKLSLAHNVYNSEYYITKCYIYDFNLEKRNTYLYFPKENISIKSNLIHYKLFDIYTVSRQDNCIIIKSNENDSIVQLPMNKTLKVKINGKPDIYNIDKSIVLEFL